MATLFKHAHYNIKCCIRHTQSLMRHTHTLLRNCQDNTKLAGHCTACYKIEWIYMKSKVRGPDNLELALTLKRKMAFFEHLVLACTIDLMNDLSLVKVRSDLDWVKNAWVDIIHQIYQKIYLIDRLNQLINNMALPSSVNPVEEIFRGKGRHF